MDKKNINNLGKEKLGKKINEHESQDSIMGATVLPDEALDFVSGGLGICNSNCSVCGKFDLRYSLNFNHMYCGNCANTYVKDAFDYEVTLNRCPKCGGSDVYYSFNGASINCSSCGNEFFKDWSTMFKK